MKDDSIFVKKVISATDEEECLCEQSHLNANGTLGSEIEDTVKSFLNECKRHE